MKLIKSKLAFITILSSLAISCSKAQIPNNGLQKTMVVTERTIEVTGSAEMKIEPDLVKLSIVLTTKNQNDKKDEFYKLLKKNKVKDKNITLEGMQQHNWWWYYNHNYDYHEQKYIITIDSEVDAINLMADLRKSWIKSVNISDKTNTKLQTYREEVKIEAVKAAKKKASYLLNALDEEIGSVVSIVEITNDKTSYNNNNYWWYQNNNQNSYTSNSVISLSSSNQQAINGMSMDKIRYEVKIIFKIK